MDCGALVQGGADGPVQPVLQVEGSLVLHYMREQVAEKGGIFSQQCFQVKGALGGHQFVQPDRTRRERRPFLGRRITMVGVRAALAHSFKYHLATLGILRAQRKYPAVPPAGCGQTVTMARQHLRLPVQAVVGAAEGSADRIEA